MAECKARERGEGAVVVMDEAPVYKKAHGTDVTCTLKRGDAVVAVCLERPWQFCEESGRARIAFVDETVGSPRGGWMRLADLEKFTYFFCNYRATAVTPYDTVYDSGYPFTPVDDPYSSAVKRSWSVCFQEARDAKLKELRAGT